MLIVRHAQRIGHSPLITRLCGKDLIGCSNHLAALCSTDSPLRPRVAAYRT